MEEANVKADKKIHNRTEDAAADRAKNEDSSSATVEDGPTSLTGFGKIAEPPALPIICRDDDLVGEEAEAVSLVQGDAYDNNRRWLTARRHSLYINDEGHLYPTSFLLEPPVKSLRRKPAGQTSTSLPFLLGGRSYKRNQGKIWCLIRAVVKVICSAACFWGGGARCFVGGLFGTLQCLKKNLNAPRPSEHPPVRGKKCQNV